jgi:hypothetical protein
MTSATQAAIEDVAAEFDRLWNQHDMDAWAALFAAHGNLHVAAA